MRFARSANAAAPAAYVASDETSQWFASRAHDRPFAFENICAALGIALDLRETGLSKRELIERKSGDKRYVRRDEAGHFTKEQDEVGRSLAQDSVKKERKQAKWKAPARSLGRSRSAPESPVAHGGRGR